MALARFYMSTFELSAGLAAALWTCGLILGKVIYLLLSAMLQAKVTGFISAAAALFSGLLWFVSALIQQTLNSMEATEELSSLLAATMEWQTEAAIAASVAAFFAIAAFLSNRD